VNEIDIYPICVSTRCNDWKLLNNTEYGGSVRKSNRESLTD
jgi:hypothetical protein